MASYALLLFATLPRYSATPETHPEQSSIQSASVTIRDGSRSVNDQDFVRIWGICLEKDEFLY